MIIDPVSPMSSQSSGAKDRVMGDESAEVLGRVDMELQNREMELEGVEDDD